MKSNFISKGLQDNRRIFGGDRPAGGQTPGKDVLALPYQRNIIKDLQDIAVAPFSVQTVVNYITHILDERHIPYKLDDYSVVVHQNAKASQQTRRKLVILAHVDHPGIVLKSATSGVFWGSPDFKRLQKLLENSSIPITVFDQKGNRQGKGKITAVTMDNTHKVSVETESSIHRKVQPNFTAQYTLPSFSENSEYYQLYNADNAVSVATLLSIILQNIKSNYDVYYVFTLHEEVHQISACHMAKKNSLGVTKNDLILNLECQTVENIDERKYPTADYKRGVVLQLSNFGCLFGYRFTGRNDLEDMIRSVCVDAGIPLQTGIIKDSCDSRPFSYFGTTPHICTLNVPNRYKHNRGENGEIVPEQVRKDDVIKIERILVSLMQFKETPKQVSLKNTSLELRNHDEVTDHALMEQKAILNERLDLAYRDRIRRGYYFPISFRDRIFDMFWKGLSYIRWGFLQIRRKVKSNSTIYSHDPIQR